MGSVGPPPGEWPVCHPCLWRWVEGHEGHDLSCWVAGWVPPLLWGREEWASCWRTMPSGDEWVTLLGLQEPLGGLVSKAAPFCRLWERKSPFPRSGCLGRSGDQMSHSYFTASLLSFLHPCMRLREWKRGGKGCSP